MPIWPPHLRIAGTTAWYATPTGLTACVWDLRLMAFERQSWLETVLANPSGPDLEAYLACRLNEDV
ncbi:MAG TPA: hypothetical protein VLA49_11090 [Anaerolineales bacterium]|nr:hypothetical protein [Anaerolineales bacterium]